jgi:hypothetical protein
MVYRAGAFQRLVAFVAIRDYGPFAGLHRDATGITIGPCRVDVAQHRTTIERSFCECTQCSFLLSDKYRQLVKKPRKRKRLAATSYDNNTTSPNDNDET